MAARDQVVDDLHALSETLPLKSDDLEAAFKKLQQTAESEFCKRCDTAGVPEEDSTWKEHLEELQRMLSDKQQIIEQDNERQIMELVAGVTHRYEDLLREKVDALINDGDLLNCDLAAYIEKHDEVVDEMTKEYATEISIASEAMLKSSLEQFIKHAKDLRSRNLERVRLMQLAEAEKKQKMMLGLAAVLIVVAIGIDGDPFDELLSVLRLLWFLPVMCMAAAGYFFMYGTPPPYTMQAATTVMKTANDIMAHIKVPEEGADKKPKKD